MVILSDDVISLTPVLWDTVQASRPAVPDVRSAE